MMKRLQAGAWTAPFCIICCSDFVFRYENGRNLGVKLFCGEQTSPEIIQNGLRIVIANGAEHPHAAKPVHPEW